MLFGRTLAGFTIRKLVSGLNLNFLFVDNPACPANAGVRLTGRPDRQNYFLSDLPAGRQACFLFNSGILVFSEMIELFVLKFGEFI
jgi:hypothetical protein